MHLSMWTYAWDIQDIGYDAALHDLRERAGLNCISFATSYHAGRFLQPRSPRRKTYFPEDGTVYFRPTPARWDGVPIQPQIAEVVRSGGDVLAELVRRRDREGLNVSCWTVCLHNTRLGMLHPDVVTRNAFDDPNYYSLCPSHPSARAYAAALVEDVTRSYRPDLVELESPSFMGFAHEYHHEKDGVGLMPEDIFLLSLCFCPSCLARSKNAGIDSAAARQTVRRWIAESCERATPAPRFANFPAGGLETFRPYPELYDYLLWRFEPVTSLVAEIRERANPTTKVVVIDFKNSWLDGCDPAAFGKVADGAVLCAYSMTPDEVTALVAAARKMLGRDNFLAVGLRVFYPEVGSPEDLTARARAAVLAGADGINFYNYGLVPAARLDWVQAAVDVVRTIAK
jgi:hypothetical protein